MEEKQVKPKGIRFSFKKKSVISRTPEETSSPLPMVPTSQHDEREAARKDRQKEREYDIAKLNDYALIIYHNCAAKPNYSLRKVERIEEQASRTAFIRSNWLIKSLLVGEEYWKHLEHHPVTPVDLSFSLKDTLKDFAQNIKYLFLAPKAFKSLDPLYFGCITNPKKYSARIKASKEYLKTCKGQV